MHGGEESAWMTLQLDKETYGDVEEMLCPFGQKVLVRQPERHGLQNVS